MKKLSFVLFFTFFSTNIFANEFICKRINTDFMFGAVAADVTNKVGMVQDFIGKTHEGTVTLVTPINNGQRINLYFTFKDGFFGVDAVELTLLMTKDSSQIIGVGYKKYNNKFHLEQSYGTHSLTCQTN